MKNTYVEINDVESYFTYIKTLEGYGNINLSEKDSLLYSSGEKIYMTGNCEKASEVFRNYLNEFQNGSFRLNAQFYLAECAYSKNSMDEALKYYLEVVQVPNNEFMEQSLKAIATITLEKEDYTKSLGYFEQLEKISEKPENLLFAVKGELKSASGSGDPQKTIIAADKIIASSNRPEELLREAYFLSAKAHYNLNDYDEALRAFRKISNEITSSEGAESKYRVAEILNRKGQTAEAEKIINEFIDQHTPQQFWMARIFLLLADISIKKGDKIQARATLQGLKDNYPVNSDGILDEVKSKLDSLNPPGKENEGTTEKVSQDSVTIKRK